MSPENSPSSTQVQYLEKEQNILNQPPFHDYVDKVIETLSEPIEDEAGFKKVLGIVHFSIRSAIRDKILTSYKTEFNRNIVPLFPSLDVAQNLVINIRQEILQTPYLFQYIIDYWNPGIYKADGQRRIDNHSQQFLDRFPTYLSYLEIRSKADKNAKLLGLPEDLIALGLATKPIARRTNMNTISHFFKLINSEALK
jgi:hypothetical protein